MSEKDILWKFELAEAQLSDDIEFLHCIEQEHFVFKEPQESITYLYWQMQSMVKTLIKSMEYNQREMKETIDKCYEELRKEGKN